MKSAALALVLTLAVGLAAACDEDKPPPRRDPSPKALASALGIADAMPLVDPPRPAGDLKADLEGFTTIDACMKQHANLDPVVGDALGAIGYDTFLRDACRVLEAAKTRDPKKCALIDASALQRRCESIVAIVAAKPDGCPLRAKPELGRDGWCLAAALRSPAMCEAEEPRRRAACEAMVGRDAKKCDAVVLDEEKPDCTRDAARFASIIGDGEAKVTSVPKGGGSLEIHGAEGRADPAETKVDLVLDVGAGLTLVKEAKGVRAAFGDWGDPSLSLHAAPPLSRARFGAVLGLADDGPAEVRELDLGVPGAAFIACPAVKCSVKVRVTKLDRTRGGAAELTIDGEVGVPPEAFKVHADIHTFVRDIVLPE